MNHRKLRSLHAAGLAGLLILAGLLAAASAGADELDGRDTQDAQAEEFTPLLSLFERQPLHAEAAGPKGLYRSFGKNLKVGLSYSRPEFSSELASLEDHRVFFNVVGML